MYYHMRNALCVIMLLFVCLFVFASQSLQLFSEKKYHELSQEYGTNVTDRLDKWKKLVEKNQNKTEKEKLTLVNDFFNRNRQLIPH